MIKHYSDGFDAISAQARKHPLLIACDFDGTLCPIVSRPQDAKLGPKAAAVLRELQSCNGIVLAILSGREIGDLMSRVPVDTVFGGNHGLQLRGRGISFDHAAAEQLRLHLRERCNRAEQVLQPFRGVELEFKGVTATLHYRNLEPELVQLCLDSFRGHWRGDKLFRLRPAKKAVEIVPLVNWDKGRAVLYLRRRIGALACICLGDDLTDETMFAANSDGLNVRVGSSGTETHAGYFAADPDEACELLRLIATLTKSSVTGCEVATPPVTGEEHEARS